MVLDSLGGPEGLGQLLAVEPALLLLLPVQLILLPPAEIVEEDAQQKSDQHRGHHDENVLVDGPALLLDGLHGHVAHQKDGSAVHRPHIVEGVPAPDVVVKEDVLPLLQTVLHLRLDGRVLNAVGPVEVGQVQVPRVPLPHPLGLEDKPPALRVHDIQGCLLVVESAGQGSVHSVVDILGVERSDGPPVPLDGAFDGVGPGAHVVDVGLGHRHAVHGSPCGEVQALLGKPLPGVGDALGPPGEDQRHLRHRLIPLIGAHIGLRVLHPGDLLGDQCLELRLTVENRLNGTLDEIQTLAEVLNRRGGHLPGDPPGNLMHNRPQYTKNQDDGEEQGQPSPPFLLVRFPIHWQSPFRLPGSAVPGRLPQKALQTMVGRAAYSARTLLYYFYQTGVNSFQGGGGGNPPAAARGIEKGPGGMASLRDLCCFPRSHPRRAGQRMVVPCLFPVG